MPRFGKRSRELLATAHPDLQRIFNEVVKYWDCTIIYAHRTVKEQQALYAQGRTKPGVKVTDKDGVRKKSMHNYYPSLAVDAACWPIDWDNDMEFYVFGGAVLMVAKQLGINVRWGYNWDGDRDYKDQSFYDGPHFELIL